MNIIYKQTSSNTKPLLTDLSSSGAGVYIRRDIKEVHVEDQQNNILTRYDYQEAFISHGEYEQYKTELMINELKGNDNTQAFDNFQEKLNTAVLYSNSKTYKPRYYEDYSNIMKDLETAISLLKTTKEELALALQNPDITPEQAAEYSTLITQIQTGLLTILTQKFPVYDSTGLVENMIQMTAAEVITLYFFLYSKKEQFFAEYKLEKQEFESSEVES